MFKVIKLRNKRPGCCVCGDSPSITSLIDYVQFCGSGPNDKARNLSVLDPLERITVHEYNAISHTPHVLLDVRQSIQYKICQLPNSIHFPFKDLEKNLDCIQEVITQVGKRNGIRDENVPVYVLCRRGNDSQLAVNLMRQTLFSDQTILKDIVGGISQWNQIEKGFPVY